MQYVVSCISPLQYPIEILFGLLRSKSEIVSFQGDRYCFVEWGKPACFFIDEQTDKPIPEIIDTIWLSIIEKTFYSVVNSLPTKKLEKVFKIHDDVSGEPVFEYLVIGVAPYGGLAIWVHGATKSVLIDWIHGEKTEVDMKDFLPLTPNVSLDDYCKSVIENDSIAPKNFKTNGGLKRDLYKKYMQQFNYRYLTLFEHWVKDHEEWKNYNDDEIIPEFDFIEETLFDGTHDKLHDGALMNYHQAGKPKKLAVKWHIKKSEYTAYFWFEDEEICKVFDRFYGAHPETKTDFMIRIDSEHNKYELSLYRYGLKEPQVISESAFQLLVFKNKFEYYRSENYDQPRGAWIW